jgi:hypothetical protein
MTRALIEGVSENTRGEVSTNTTSRGKNSNGHNI